MTEEYKDTKIILMEEKTRIRSSLFLATVCKILEKSTEFSFHTLDEIIYEVLEEVVKIMKAKAGTVRLYNEEREELILKVTYGLSKKYTEKPAIKVGESVAGLVFQTGKPLVVEHLRKDKRYLYPEFPLKEKVFSLISAPLKTSDKKLGVVSVYFSLPRSFSKEEIDFFSIMAHFVSIIINNYSLQEELYRHHRETIASLILELESKDPYLKGHSERVAELSEKIARELRLPPHEVRIIREMAVLHDLGKIVLDSTIMHKPGPLTPEEWAIMKQHPLLGERIVSPIKAMEKGRALIRHHHERVDGKGYPNGLKGDSIPLSAKIVAVADAYDAMTSLRPYRSAYSKEKAIEELKKNAGKQFDKRVVEVALRVLERKNGCQT
ncbi:HD-GYP domain-containing protein [Candidatus Calescamantes bacterium]|nr:HD-GYP domain-containing protein [Candidatus Calescamantes bacterium]